MSHRNQKKHFSSSPPLEAVQEQFESWRQTRRHRSPIPEELWQAAISLCKNNSIYEISKALHLSYTKLKERVSASKALDATEASSHPDFIELDFGRPVFPLEYAIEMEAKNGAKMRIQIQGGKDFDLPGLVESFWTRSS